ncbi:MAG TPA: F0F1 ATP synthase subunit B [Pseudonocardiaceae bacterium]|jgi:ATP synthase F0 subunit b|nr:F0F1 ATP synthase subunit B [Pseudonocardiaceae bacterium]
MADYIAELVGFVIVVAVLWWKVVPPVRTAMRRTQDQIAKQVEEAAAAAALLAEAERKYRDALAEARTEAAKIRDAARADAQRIVVEMREAAEREVERIRQRGADDLIAQRQQVIRELRTRIGALSVDLAGELVAEHLASQQNRSATVDRLLDELAAMSAPAEGS